MRDLRWLPEATGFAPLLKQAAADPALDWPALVALARLRLDFLQTDRLDRLLRTRFAAPPPGLVAPVRLAILGSSTMAHLHAGIRVAALRRGLWLEVYETEYGQYLQELLDPASPLHRFRPTVVLMAQDARHLVQDAPPAMLDRLRQCWRLARGAFRCTVLQQAPLPVLPLVLGQNEQRLADAPAAALATLTALLRHAVDEDGVHLVAVDAAAAQDGVRAWHSPVLWHRAKQEVSPVVAPAYGELVARLVAAAAGRSAKCLVLDLDNTIWGGVIGDDGLDGIVLGQNSADGEAFVAVQEYAARLARRGVILAVCSKNDEAVALAAFERHPEMVLRRDQIACFMANWDDKATNLRRIAEALNIGLDSLVFLDDNPFERNLVRTELPEVAVPEIPDDDPAGVPDLLADAGYFEGLAITDADLARTAQYQANTARAAAAGGATDLPAYLRGLEMRLVWRRFDPVGLARITQLINKTNQFNLTTRRYTEAEVLAIMDDARAFGLQLRLLDRFGDNGIIAIVIGRMQGPDCVLDTWLMSCRVLGRGVEAATLNVVAGCALALNATRLLGEYRPTARNGMVAGHYERLGFAPLGDGRFGLDLGPFEPRPVFMTIEEGVGG